MKHAPMAKTRAEIVRIVKDECFETLRAADILDNDRDRILVRMTVAVLWAAIRARVEGRR